MHLIHEERSFKGMFLKYQIFDDRIKLQSLLLLITTEIPYKTIIDFDIRTGPVIADMAKRGYFKDPAINITRVIKNDWADLCKHMMIRWKKNGKSTEIHFTPQNVDQFFNLFQSVLSDYRSRHQKKPF